MEQGHCIAAKWPCFFSIWVVWRVLAGDPLCRVEGAAALKPQEATKVSSVEADDDLAINHGGGCCSGLQGDQLSQQAAVFGDVFLGKRDVVLSKELLLRMAGRSPRLGIDDYLLCHAHPSSLYRVQPWEWLHTEYTALVGC